MTSLAKRSIDNQTADKLMEAVAGRARAINVNMCVAVCDEAGHLKAFARMDGAPLIAVQIAQDKAYTAVSFGIPTHAWYDFIKGDPPLLHGIAHYPRLIIFGGGYPIKEDGQVIGGVGVSGGHYTQDMECALAGLKAIGAAVD